MAALDPAARDALLDVQDWMANPASDLARLHDARERLIAGCMKDAGQAYTPTPSAPIDVDLTGGFSPLSLAIARSSGYPPASDDASSAQPDPNATSAADSRWRAAYSNSASEVVFDLPDGNGQGGMATGGCLGDSLRRLYGADLTAYVRADMIVTNLPGTIVRTAIEAPRVRDATLRWRACMAKRGMRFRWPTRAVATDDRATAVIDATCRARSQLPPAYAAAFQRSAPRLLRSNRRVLAQWRAYRAIGLEHAERLGVE